MNNSAGYTLAELVVTIVLLGTLTAVAVPTYNKVINKAQKQANLSDMETIKNTFMQYFYVTHMQGNPHFPPEPENSLLDSTYRKITLEDGLGRSYNSILRNFGNPEMSTYNPLVHLDRAKDEGIDLTKFY